MYCLGITKVLFVGGGSIGHIAPAVAIAQELKKNAGCACMFVCGINSNEANFIKKYVFPYATLPGVRRYCISALIQSHRILSKEQPDLILSKGGYVSIPLCLVAWVKTIPIILHESDAVMGRANWLISKLASHVCLGYSTFEMLCSTFTGNPIRQEITKGSREQGLRITGFSGQKPILLVLGGSQGAKALNEIVWKNLDQLLNIVDIAHIIGPSKRPTTRYQLPTHQGYWSIDFAYDELPHLYAIADIALSRAGANTIAELDANRVPTILVPLRGVGHDHQYQNAMATAQKNPLFVHVEQEELDEKLISTIHVMVSSTNHDTLRRAQGDIVSAASKITKVILDHLERPSGHP